MTSYVSNSLVSGPTEAVDFPTGVLYIYNYCDDLNKRATLRCQ